MVEVIKTLDERKEKLISLGKKQGYNVNCAKG